VYVLSSGLWVEYHRLCRSAKSMVAGVRSTALPPAVDDHIITRIRGS